MSLRPSDLRVGGASLTVHPCNNGRVDWSGGQMGSSIPASTVGSDTGPSHLLAVLWLWNKQC